MTKVLTPQEVLLLRRCGFEHTTEFPSIAEEQALACSAAKQEITARTDRTGEKCFSMVNQKTKHMTSAVSIKKMSVPSEMDMSQYQDVYSISLHVVDVASLVDSSSGLVSFISIL